jgi:sulfatase modifying factor 1
MFSWDSYYLDRYPVTNQSFGEFISATGYKTEAEKFGWSFIFARGLDRTSAASEAVNGLQWWRAVDGADWRHPEGLNSSISNRESFPVVHFSWNDAMHSMATRLAGTPATLSSEPASFR